VGTCFLECFASERPSAAGPGLNAEFHLRVPRPRGLDDSEHRAPSWDVEVSVDELTAWASLLAAGDLICRESSAWFHRQPSRAPCHCASGSHPVADRSGWECRGAMESLNASLFSQLATLRERGSVQKLGDDHLEVEFNVDRDSSTSSSGHVRRRPLGERPAARAPAVLAEVSARADRSARSAVEPSVGEHDRSIALGPADELLRDQRSRSGRSRSSCPNSSSQGRAGGDEAGDCGVIAAHSVQEFERSVHSLAMASVTEGPRAIGGAASPSPRGSLSGHRDTGRAGRQGGWSGIEERTVS